MPHLHSVNDRHDNRGTAAQSMQVDGGLHLCCSRVITGFAASGKKHMMHRVRLVHVWDVVHSSQQLEGGIHL